MPDRPLHSAILHWHKDRVTVLCPRHHLVTSISTSGLMFAGSRDEAELSAFAGPRMPASPAWRASPSSRTSHARSATAADWCGASLPHRPRKRRGRQMCQDRDSTVVRVCIAPHLSHSGEAYWRDMPIDRCIAPLVKALNDGGILTSQSCCGHGTGPGRIDLFDGRFLIVVAAPTKETK